MSQTSDARQTILDEVLQSRRDGLAMRYGGVPYEELDSAAVSDAILRIIELQDSMLLPSPAGRCFKCGEPSDGAGAEALCSYHRDNLWSTNHYTIPYEEVRAGLRLVDEAGARYVLVPAAYVSIQERNGGLVCGSGPETCEASLSQNPNWLWNHAGNAAALAMELEKRSG